MKPKLIILLFLAVACSFGIVQSSMAQCTCDQTRLNNIIDNANIKIVSSYGSNTAVTSISPGSTYYLRIQATSHTCITSGSGCNYIASPVAFFIDLVDGCTVYGDYVPPRVGVDVGSSSNYTAYFRINTFTGGDFLDQLYFRVGAACLPTGCIGLTWANPSSQRTILLP